MSIAYCNHLYRHFQGRVYIVHFTLATNESTGEVCVIYQRWEAGRPTGPAIVRPKHEFEGLIRGGEYRFTHIGYAYPEPSTPDEW